MLDLDQITEFGALGIYLVVLVWIGLKSSGKIHNTLDYTVAGAALTLGGVLDQFPGLRFTFFEAGATWMSYAMHGADRSFFIERACSRTNTRPSELILRHCMTAIENVEPLEQLVAVYGADNYVIGTDFPHPEFQRLPNTSDGIAENPALAEADKVKILGGNYARTLRL